MNFPKGGRRQCLVEGCPGVSETGGVRQPDHGGVQAENNGGREFISGTTARESGVQECWAELAAGSLSSHLMT